MSRSGAVYAGLTQDGMPLIGPVDDVEGLFISCGHTYVAPKQTRARPLLREGRKPDLLALLTELNHMVPPTPHTWITVHELVRSTGCRVGESV